MKGAKLKIAGFGSDPRVLDDLRARRILATIDWHPERQGIPAIEKLLEGALMEDRKTS